MTHSTGANTLKDLKRTFYLSLFLLLLTTVTFIQVPFFDFVVLEDTTYLDTNPYFSKIESSKILELWKRPYLHYMPLTYSLWGVAAHLTEKKPLEQIPKSKTGVLKEFRFNPFLFHSLTLVFHLGSVFLLFWFLCFLTHHPMASFLASLLFAIHPVQVESVAWVSGLKETLGGFFSILSLFLFLMGQERPPRSRSYQLFFLASTSSFILGLCSNPSTIALPWMALVLQYFLYKKERFLVGAKSLFIWIGISIPFLLAEKTGKSWASGLAPGLQLKEKVILGLDSLSFSFRQLLFPLNLGVDYGRTPEWVLNHTSVHTTAVLFFVFIFSLTLFLKWNKIQWALAAESIFLAALLPSFFFSRLLFQTSSSVADQDLYLPLIGLVIGFAFALKLFFNKPAVALGSVIFLVLLVTRSYFQTFYWKDTPSLMNQALKVNPDSTLAHQTLARFYEREENYEEAISHFKFSAALSPDPAIFHQLGNIELALGHFKEAKVQFENALTLSPLSAKDYHGLGLSLVGMGDKLRAQDTFAKAKALSPRDWNSTTALRHLHRDLVSNNKKQRPGTRRKGH